MNKLLNIAKYIFDVCLIVLSMHSVTSKRLSGVEVGGRMELSLWKHENSGLTHWVQSIHRSRSKTDKVSVLERKIYYKMTATARQVNKPHVLGSGVKGDGGYMSLGFLFLFG